MSFDFADTLSKIQSIEKIEKLEEDLRQEKKSHLDHLNFIMHIRAESMVVIEALSVHEDPLVRAQVSRLRVIMGVPE